MKQRKRTALRRHGPYRVKREDDGCYFVVHGQRRGPKKHSKKLAVQRFEERGFIA